MSVLRRRWQMKPSVGIGLSGYYRPNKLCVLLNEGGGSLIHNLANPVIGTAGLSNGVIWDYTSAGQVLAHTQTDSIVTFGTDTQLGLTMSAVTVILGCRKRDTTLRSGSAFGTVDGNSANRFGTAIPYSDGNVYWDFGDISGTGRISKAWSPDTASHVWSFSAGSRGMEIWKDSVKMQSSGSSSSYTSSNSNFTLGNYAAIGSDFTDFSFIYVWSYQLPQAVIQAIALDPYLILNPPGPRRVRSVPSISTSLNVSVRELVLVQSEVSG